MKIKIGFSPCPNDTFIFDALVNKLIDTGELEFEPVLADVETLNNWALGQKLDVTKLSFPAYFNSLPHYTLLDAGSALGKGVGPLLVSKDPDKLSDADITHTLIALPGRQTTAHFLFSFAYPQATHKQFMPFNEIEDFVLQGKSDGGKRLGVIIHESRFTYRQKGLHRVADLGEFWENKMQVPIPLGGIAIKSSIDRSVAENVNRLIVESLSKAFSAYPSLSTYVTSHSQELSEEVMRQHIELYVNNYSIELGEHGRRAIEVLYSVYQKMYPEGTVNADLFMNSV